MEKEPKEEKDIHKADDHLFSRVMSNRDSAEAYIRHFYPALAAMADFPTLEAMPTDSITEKLRLFRSDVLYRCRIKGEGERFFNFAFLFEHKSAPDEQVAIQIGAYIMLELRRQVAEKRKPLEPVIPLLFYNGKRRWQPKTLPQMFEGMPYFSDLRRYIPDFQFLFTDATKVPLDHLMTIRTAYLRGAVLSMVLKHDPDLFIEHFSVIFDLEERQDEITLATYMLAVISRKPQELIKILKSGDKAKNKVVMSTLELIQQEAAKEGHEEGAKKEKTFYLLRTVSKLPQLSAGELSETADWPMLQVQALLSHLQQGHSSEADAFIKQTLLKNVALTPEEEANLQKLIGAAVASLSGQ